jgi:hypothetical protein
MRNSWSLLGQLDVFWRTSKRDNTPTKLSNGQVVKVEKQNTLSPSSPVIPEAQTVLLLHSPKQPYRVTENYPVPRRQNDQEVLIQCKAIGLNPIDWKAPYVKETSRWAEF